jgi:hypothetical protein
MCQLPLRLDSPDILQKRSRNYKMYHNFHYSSINPSFLRHNVKDLIIFVEITNSMH